MTKTCPRCQSESMDQGVCLFCGPEATRARADRAADAQEQVSAAWKGFDRELGAKKRREREEAQVARARDEDERSAGMPWGTAIGGVLGVAVLAGLAWMFFTGRMQPASRVDRLTGMPNVLVKPPSAARTDLALFARALDELVTEAEHRLTTNPDVVNADIERYLNRLANLHEVGRELEPRLTREEQRVLMGLQNAERHAGAFMRSFLTKVPDLLGARARTALEQIRRAQALARGESVDDVVVRYQEKAGAAAAMERALDTR